jgi:hypothetical protein
MFCFFRMLSPASQIFFRIIRLELADLQQVVMLQTVSMNVVDESLYVRVSTFVTYALFTAV